MGQKGRCVGPDTFRTKEAQAAVRSGFNEECYRYESRSFVDSKSGDQGTPSMSSPSTTYLFDGFRSGRMRFPKGDRQTPSLRWEFTLPSHPPKGSESAPAFDDEGHIYFGAHDGCFYSLDPSGRLRWMFKTGAKIYSSPAIRDGRIFFASGDGYLFCFGNDGTKVWVYNICDYFSRIRNKIVRKVLQFKTNITAYDAQRKKRWLTKCWSSPNLDDSGTVYITGYGLGLHAVNAEDGRLLWTFDLGSPRHHLSGVAMNEHGQIFVASQRRFLHCLSRNGDRKWSFDSRLCYDTWGNPSIDIENEVVCFPMTRKEKEGCLVALDYRGRARWRTDIPGGLRGSAAISYQDYLVIGSLNGRLYFIGRKNGQILREIQLTTAQRGLWTTPSIDPAGYIFVTTKDSRYSGSLCCLAVDGEVEWRIPIGKALSTPVVGRGGRVYVGSWDGKFLCYQT